MQFVCLVMCGFLNFFSAGVLGRCTWEMVDAVCLFGYV
jgi:hypothetical protein